MMKLIADLQLHSPLARAVSKNMTLENISLWAAKKGIDLVTPGDWTHPVRYKEIGNKMIEVGEGIYRLNSKFKMQNSKVREVNFALVTEVSCVFRQDEKYHGIHILVFAPNLETVEKINKKLSSLGQNLLSDGRPILNLNCRDLAAAILDVDEKCLLIPAHSWTPWFGFYGAHGGFDSLDEAFGDYSKYIYAIETGLGSDPAMNWRIAELDSRNIVSFSDAHSLEKIGREATVFEMPDLTYSAIREAITNWNVEDRSRRLDIEIGSKNVLSPTSIFNNPVSKIQPHISFTVEFYRQEGKYHATGHRKCGVVFLPNETPKGFVCPVCGKKLTVGAAQRTEDLGQRTENTEHRFDKNSVRWVYSKDQPKRPPFVNIVPLQEVLSEVLGVGVGSKKVKNEYERLVGFAPEFEILLGMSLEEIKEIGDDRLREAIEKNRRGEVIINPGGDGVFGEIRIELEDEVAESEQMGYYSLALNGSKTRIV